MHELTHLATEGNRYRMAVMKAGGSDLSVAGLSNGWARRKALRVKLVAGRWHFGSIDDCGSRGVFFEEATAEIVSLRWAWKHGLKGSEIPTTYAVGEKVFTLPPEFGEDVAAYGILALEQACPGVLQTLVDGARGKRDFRRLKQVIDNAFPGLFGELDELQRQSGEWAHSRGLAAGTAMILERMSVDERT
ncbi:MAG TPA: hypothetical protein VK978_02705 [Candidatus Saccharimonadales bacterium]|nr:hypothetical protein [Candidatus Saccharimonadales bacterium]